MSKVEENPVRMLAVIEGRVQGVGFRYFTQREATTLGLVGHVRNQWDGTVEVVAEGSAALLRQLLARLRVGPSASRVQSVRAEWHPPSGEYRSFIVRY